MSDLKILITGTLDPEKSKEAINAAILELESKINKITLNVEVNPQAQSSIKNLSQQISQLSSPTTQNATRSVNNNIQNIGNSAHQATSHVNSFGGALAEAFRKFPVWLISGSIIMNTINFFKDGISYVNQLNASLTQISIVTGKNQQQVAALGDQYNLLAKQLGVTTGDIADAAVEFYRQGLSQEEVMKRVQVATEYAKISNLDFKDSAEILTATTNSMNISITRASDVFSYLGDATASGADEIGKAYQKMGGSVSALQIPFEKAASWVAELESKTREAPETIGQSIKSILARVQSLKSAGYTSDDNTSVNQVSKALNTVGIQLMNAKGEFNDFSKIMDSLGAKWKDLDSRTQAYIATVMAGSFQQSRFENLMNGYADSVKLYDQSLSAAGTTQSKFNLYQESTAAAISRLQASMENLWSNAFKSDQLQNLINGLNFLVTSIGSVVKNVGLLPVVLGTATTAFMLFNKNIRTNITSFGILTNSLARTGDAMVIGSTKSKILQSAMYQLTLAGRGTGVAMEFLGTAIKSAFSFVATTALPIAAIMGISYAIEKATEFISKQREEEKQLQQQEQQLVDSYKSHKEQVSSLANEYDALSKAKNTGGLNADQEQKYVDVQNQLAKILPTVKEGENAKGDAILKSSSAIKEQIKLLEQEIELEKTKKKLDAPESIQKSASNISDAQKDVEMHKKAAEEFADEIKQNEKAKTNHSLILNLIKMQNGELLKQNEAQSKINTEQQKSAELIKGYFSDSKIDPTSIVEISSALSQINLKGKDAGEIDTFFKTVSADVNNLSVALKDNNEKGIKETEKNLVELGIKGSVLKAIIETLSGSQKQGADAAKQHSNALASESLSADQLAKKLQDAKGSFEDTKNVILDMVKAKEFDKAITASQGQAYSALSEELSPINKALEDMANGKKMSADEAMNLISKEQDLAKYISIENGQVKLNEKGIIDLRDAKIASYNDMINAEKEQMGALDTTTQSALKSYGIQVKAILTVAQANQVLAQIQQKNAETQSKINNSNAEGAMHASIIIQNQYDTATSGINAIKDSLSQLDQISSMASTGLTQVGTSIDKTSNSTKNASYQTDKYQQQLDKLNTSLELQQKIIDKYPNYSKEYQTALKNEITLLQQQKDLIDSRAKSLQSQISNGNITDTSILSSLSSSGSNTALSTGSYNGKYSSYINQASSKYGVDSALIAAIIKAESSFNPNAHSGVGAMGLMQLMPGTAKGLGVTNAYDPYQNIMGGTKYIADQLVAFGGDISKALAAYNAGAGNVRKYNGIPPFAETQNYVKAVEQYYQQYGGGNVSSSSISSGKSTSIGQQAIDEAKKQLNGLLSQSADIQNQIEQTELTLIKTPLTQADQRFKQIDSAMKIYDARLSHESSTSKEYQTDIKNENLLLEEKKKLIEANMVYLEKELETNKNLTPAMKADLQNTYLDLRNSLVDIDNSIVDNINKIKDQYTTIADQAIAAEKAYYQQRKDNQDKYYADEKQKIQDTYQAAMDAIDRQSATDDYNKSLSDMQKQAQDIQNQINKQSLDNSQESQSKVLDLKKQLADKQQEIADAQNKHSIDMQKQSLQDQQTQQENAIDTQQKYWDDYYDNILNDDQKWADQREEIMKGNTKALTDTLSTFSTDVQNNMKDIGTSIQTNLLDQISKANTALQGINGKSYDSYTNAQSSSPSTPSGSSQNNSGTLEILKDINLWKRNGDKLEMVRVLHPGEKYHVYGYDDKFGGQWNVGGGDWVTNMSGYVKKYHQGGIVEGGSPNKLTQLANRLFNTSPNEQTVVALKNELFSPERNMPNFFGNLKILTDSLISKTPAVNTIHFDKLIQIDNIEKDANLDIDQLVDTTLTKLMRKLRPYGFS